MEMKQFFEDSPIYEHYLAEREEEVNEQEQEKHAGQELVDMKQKFKALMGNYKALSQAVKEQNEAQMTLLEQES